MKPLNTYIEEKLVINKDYNFEKNDKIIFSKELETLNHDDAKLLDNEVNTIIRKVVGLKDNSTSIENVKTSIIKGLKTNRISQRKIDNVNYFFDSFDENSCVYWVSSNVDKTLCDFVMDNGIELFQILPYKNYGSIVLYACKGNEWTVCFFGLGDNCNLNSVSTIVIHN